MEHPNYQEYTFLEFCEYYYGLTSDISGELPLLWWDRYQPIEDEE